MKDLSKLILPLGLVAIMGACAPYPPYPGQGQASQSTQEQQAQQTSADEEQRKIAEKRRRLEEEADRKREQQEASIPTPPSPPKKTTYPTATRVPGKDGFVFNPYTQNIVDVKGIGSGKLVRDPEDANADHKFRVP